LGVERRHAKGDTVFGGDRVAEGVILLERGAIRLTFDTALGGSVVLCEQTAPAVIISSGVLDGGSNCATATAASECVTYVVARGSFFRFCRRNPNVAIRVLSELGGHLRRTSAFIDLVTAAGTHQRIARVLLELMEEAGALHFTLPCSHGELAMRVGTVRELIYRNLKMFEARGILKADRRDIVITDAAALRAEAGVPRYATRVFETRATPPVPACVVLGPASLREH
jgi:CRP/FNR family transcriptional regulator